MRSVLDDSDEDRLSILRATAIALGLPLLVLETIEGLDFRRRPEREAGASPGVLVLVVGRLGATTESHANEGKEGVHDG